jgi:hypothetical protein
VEKWRAKRILQLATITSMRMITSDPTSARDLRENKRRFIELSSFTWLELLVR